MATKKIRKPAPKKPPVKKKAPPGVEKRIMSLEQRLMMAKQAQEQHLARANAAAGQAALIEELMKERDAEDAEKEV